MTNQMFLNTGVSCAILELLNCYSSRNPIRYYLLADNSVISVILFILTIHFVLGMHVEIRCLPVNAFNKAYNSDEEKESICIWSHILETLTNLLLLDVGSMI